MPKSHTQCRSIASTKAIVDVCRATRQAWVMRTLLVVVGACALIACGDDTSNPRTDTGPRRDGDPPPDVPADLDSDDDGVCDATEIERGLNPASADTDEDGFSDYVEVLLGFNAVDGASPNRDTVVVLRESAVGSLQVPLTVSTRGSGEDFEGAFQSLGSPDEAGDTAMTFYTESVATFAEPMENVAIIDDELQAFRGVVGTTLMGFEVRFEFGDATPRGCARGYSWRYNIKRSDGRIVSAQTYLLLVLPPGQSLEGSAQWCLPFGGCI